MLTKGERLHNPFNLEYNKAVQWQGMITPSTDPVFCEFTTDVYGLRAGFVNLRNQIKEGFDTIEKVVTKYAPPTKNGKVENDTAAYIEAVCNSMGRGPNAQLTLNDTKTLGLSIIHQEQGRVSASIADILKALELAGGTVEVIPTPKLSMLAKLRKLFGYRQGQ